MAAESAIELQPFTWERDDRMNGKSNKWALVLAGGDGSRLRELTGRIMGAPRPKQFCSFFGGQTLMAATRARIAPLYDEEQTLFALTRAHEPYYGAELRGVGEARTVIQPLNRGTAVAMALCLETIIGRDRDAVVAFFPSDHHYQDSEAFQAIAMEAMRLAEEYPHFVLTLGAKPTRPEVEYGWIEPGRALVAPAEAPLYRVSKFWEKPRARRAAGLMRRGCFWNTFVTVGVASAFLEILRVTVPRLVGLHALCRADLEKLYQNMPSIDFSHAVLSAAPQFLLVLEDAASGWTDLGNPRRVFDVARNADAQAAWLSGFAEAGAEFARSA